MVHILNNNHTMKSITIHNLEAEVAEAIEKMAKASGLSQNKTVKKLLRKALGLEPAKAPSPDFSEFCGLWSEEESEAFREAVSAFDEIDETLWQ